MGPTMPNCFQLSRKTSEKFSPVPLAHIDNEMCEHFKVEPHPVAYYRGWVDDIGFSLAMGKSFDQIIAQIQTAVDSLATDTDNLPYEQRRMEIAKWLNENFTSDAFYQRKF